MYWLLLSNMMAFYLDMLSVQHYSDCEYIVHHKL